MMISIIIPVYNVGVFLERCLQSVMAQTYTDWQCVLVDDGSKDQSGLICDQWKQADSRFNVIHQQNQGASMARQVGIAAARGEYFTFIDADDIIEPDYLEQLYAALTDSKVDIAACDFIKHQEGIVVEIDRSQSSRILESEELHHRFFKYDFWGFGGKIYKREVFNDIYFPEATINEDYVVMAQLFHRYKQMAYVPAQLYHYIKHEGSLSNQQLSKRMMEEWTNKLWAYHFYSKYAPQWKRYAEAQASETCCKLIGAIEQGGNPKEYTSIKKVMQKFLRSHLFSLLTNPNLLTGLKYMVIRRCI